MVKPTFYPPPPPPPPLPTAQFTWIDYTNYRGERALRRIWPRGISFGTTEYHPEPQWLLLAFDLEKQADRHFAMKDIHAWGRLNLEDNV